MAGDPLREAGANKVHAAPRDDLFLLVGHREGAVASVRRRGLAPILVGEREPSRRLRVDLAGFIRVDFGHPVDAAQVVVDGLGGARPRGILAAVERSVPTAAALCARFDRPGIRPSEAERFRDKIAMKERATAHQIPIAAHRLVTAETSARELVAELGLPLVLKPRAASGSRDLVIARNLAEVEANLVIDHIAEEFVRGVEMSVESIVAGGAIVFQNPTEYLIHGHANIVPGGIADAHLERVLRLNARVIEAFGLTDGMTHLELFITQLGDVFGEIAARPPGGYLMNLLAASYGFDPWDALVAVALGEPVSLPQAPIASSAALIVHPGEGEVRRVDGIPAIAALPGVHQARCTLRVGDRVRARRGLGEASGRVLITAQDREHLVGVLRQVQGLLDIDMAPLPPSPTCRALVDRLTGAREREEHALDLALPGVAARIRGDHRGVIDALAEYFREHRADAPHAAVDLEILALTGEAPALGLTLEIKPDDLRPAKEEWIDLDDGRVVHKRKTGVHLFMGEDVHAIVGPLDRNVDQVINFLNHRVMERWIADGGVLGHAAGVARGGRGIVLCGRAGAGKSTLALQLLADDRELAFVSNDRLVLRRRGDPLEMLGIPKHPRVNPGTILHNPSLASILGDDERERFAAIDPAALWTLEAKYDAVIDRLFGAGRFRLAADAAAIFFLRWRADDGPMAITAVDDARARPDLLALLRKRLGLFFWPQASPGRAAMDAALAAALAGVPAFEVSGGVDFHGASRFIRGSIL